MMNKNKHKDKYPKLTLDITSKFKLYPNFCSDINELSVRFWRRVHEAQGLSLQLRRPT